MRRRIGFSLKAPRAKPQEVKVNDGCAHHWIIEAPDGPSSRGICKICGLQREFLNAWNFKGNW